MGFVSEMSESLFSRNDNDERKERKKSFFCNNLFFCFTNVPILWGHLILPLTFPDKMLEKDFYLFFRKFFDDGIQI